MRIIAVSTLKAFIDTDAARADARQPVMAWYRQVKAADWASPADVKREFRSASILQDGRAVFNIAGNKYPHRGFGSTILTVSSTSGSSAAIGTTTPSMRRRFEAQAMDIAPIKTKRDYQRTLKEIEGLMTAKRNTPDGDRLDVLVILVEAWEAKHYPLDLPDPVAAIRYHMEQNELAPKDLVPYIGSRGRVYEVLNRKRPLTLKMIWRLHHDLGIPAESLIRTDSSPR